MSKTAAETELKPEQRLEPEGNWGFNGLALRLTSLGWVDRGCGVKMRRRGDGARGKPILLSSSDFNNRQRDYD